MQGKPMASPVELTALFTTLAVAGGVFTGGAFCVSYAVSVWVLVFLQFFVLAWFYLENLSLYQDLKRSKQPLESAWTLQGLQFETINAMAMECQSLRDHNALLVNGIHQFKQCSLSLMHWELLYRKVVVMHYMRIMHMNKHAERARRRQTAAHYGGALRLSRSLNDIPETHEVRFEVL